MAKLSGRREMLHEALDMANLPKMGTAEAVAAARSAIREAFDNLQREDAAAIRALTAIPTPTGERTETWRPIESAPKDGRDRLLLFIPTFAGDKIWTGVWASGWVNANGRLRDDEQPTHWRPLPAAPDTISPPPETEDAIVERVARAMFEEDRSYSDTGGLTPIKWDDVKAADNGPYWRRKARAALAAMRKPT